VYYLAVMLSNCGLLCWYVCSQRDGRQQWRTLHRLRSYHT